MSGIGNLLNRMNSFLKHLFQTIGFLSGIVTLLLFLGVGTTFAGSISQTRYLIFIGIAIVIFSIIFGITYYTLLHELTMRNKTIIPAIPINTAIDSEKAIIISPVTTTYPSLHHPENVEILRKEIVYEYLPDGLTINQRKHIKIRVLQNGINRFEDRYRWTGNGKCNVKTTTPGFTISNPHKAEDGIWDFFDVIFPRQLHVDDEVEFTIEWELFDAQMQAKPFLSSVTDSDTAFLLLQVNLPDQLAPEYAYFYEYRNFIETQPVRAEKIYWSPAAKSIRYEISNPEKYHRYLIRWFGRKYPPSTTID